MSNHQNEHQPKPEAEKIKLPVTISEHPPIDKAIDGSSLTTEEKVQRKGPMPKQRKYKGSASAAEEREYRKKRSIEEVDNLNWIPTETVAIYLGISEAAVRRLVDRNMLEGRKPFGGKLYFKKSYLDEVIESSKKVGGKNGNKKG